jgi:glycosyltransferase involved in cell wall biosynthesis
MKILHITGYTVERGGTAKIVYENAKFQLAAGHQVSILSVNFANEEPYPVPTGATLHLMKDHWLGKFISNFSLETLPFFKANTFDVIHIHGLWFWGSVAPFLVKNKAKKIITIHGMLSDWTMSQGKVKKALFGLLMQNKGLGDAKALVVNTHKEREELVKYLPVDKNKIYIVPNAVEKTKAISEADKRKFKVELGINEEDKNILFLSRIHKKKGLGLLVAAFAKVKDLGLQKTNLLIAGPDEGGYKDEIIQLIEDLEIPHTCIHFLGSVSGEKKQKCFAISDIYALTSYSEGFPMAVLEAIEAGVAVLVSDQTRIDYYIEKYEAGRVCTLSIDHIAKELNALLNDDANRNRLVSNANEMLEMEFTPQKIYTQMLDIYQKM